MNSHWSDNRSTFTEQGETIVVGRPAFVAYFYANDGFCAYAQAVLDAWLAMLPPKTSLYYSHDDSRRFMKVTSKLIAKIRNELTERRLAKMYKWFIVKSSADDGAWDECHAFSFEIYATGSYYSYVYVTFPLDYVETQSPETVSHWFCDWNQRFSFTHSGAGLGYEVAWFPEQENCVGPTMLEMSLRYHGLRAWNHSHARMHERTKQTLDTAAWLTYLDARSIQDVGLGAVEGIYEAVTRHPCGSGLVLQAGPAPDPCDSTQPNKAYALLKSINDAILPIRTTKWALKGWGDRRHPEKENGWFGRMDAMWKP